MLSRKAVIIACAIYAILTFVLPIRRVIYVWQESHVSLFAYLVNPGQYIVMCFFLVLTIYLAIDKGLLNLLNRVISFKFIAVVIYLVIVSTLILHILKVPGLWWTWTTIGLHIITVLIAPFLLAKYLTKVEAILLASGCVFFIMGIWEIIYQYGLYTVYDIPQGQSNANFITQINFMLPFSLIGLMIVAIIVWNNKQLITFKILPLALTGYTALAFILWFATGFWCDIVYDWSKMAWYQTDANIWSMMLYRSSKVSANLALLTLWRN